MSRQVPCAVTHHSRGRAISASGNVERGSTSIMVMPIMMPRISIVTVCLNSGTTLQRTIDSVRNQTYPNIEYIVIDGGSTDDTLRVISRNEECITHWSSEPDRGLYDAMNK